MATMTTRASIALANRSFMEAVAGRDAAAIARLYTEEGQVLPPHSEAIVGRNGIEAFWRAAIGRGITAVRLETVEVFDHGDSAYEVGRYTLGTAGGGTAGHGKYLVVWRLEGGEWRLHRDIWNSSAPEPD